jgi:hypothetical protein
MYFLEEMEALQTLPPGYTKAAGTDTKRGEVIGDGWTVKVIEDLLRGAKLGSERAKPMVVEPAAGGDAGAGSGGGGSSAAATQAMPPPAPLSPAPAPAPAAAQSMPSQAEMWAMMQAMRLENQATQQQLKAAEEARLAAEEKAKAATAERDQVRDSRVRKQADRDDSRSTTESDKARIAGLLKGKKGVKPTPTVTDKRNRD